MHVFRDFPAISIQMTRNCRTAARKFSAFAKSLRASILRGVFSNL